MPVRSSRVLLAACLALPAMLAGCAQTGDEVVTPRNDDKDFSAAVTPGSPHAVTVTITNETAAARLDLVITNTSNLTNGEETVEANVTLLVAGETAESWTLTLAPAQYEVIEHMVPDEALEPARQSRQHPTVTLEVSVDRGSVQIDGFLQTSDLS